MDRLTVDVNMIVGDVQLGCVPRPYVWVVVRFANDDTFDDVKHVISAAAVFR
jgi:hypothetical protein